MYNLLSHRVSPNKKASYSKLKTVTIDCMECGARQVETNGASGPRRKAISRRRYAGTTLDLCGVHAEHWAERDAEDARRR